METLYQLVELFPYALLGSIIAGIICAFLGVFIVSQRVVFLGAVLTQVAIAGVAFSFLHIVNLEGMLVSLKGMQAAGDGLIHNFEPIFYSLVFAIITVLVFSQTYRQKVLTQDIILGIIFVFAIAARILFIQKSPVAEVSEIESILKGDILFIGKEEFYSLCVILIISFSVFLLFSKQLRFVTFDPDSANAHGINSRFWMLVFYIVVGTGISLTTRFVGDVFAFSFLIIPSSIGIILAKKVKNVFLLAGIIGAIIPPISIYIAFKMDLSSGPTAVVSSFIVFLGAVGVKKLKK